MHESFGVKGPGGMQGTFTLSQHPRCSVVMDIIGGDHGDPAMAMLGVVPGEERTAEGGRGGDVFEPSGETGVVLQGLDTCASEKGLSSLTWGRLRERVTPRSARSWAVHLLVMGAVLLLVPALLALHESVATRWEDPPVQPSPATT